MDVTHHQRSHDTYEPCLHHLMHSAYDCAMNLYGAPLQVRSISYKKNHEGGSRYERDDHQWPCDTYERHMHHHMPRYYDGAMKPNTIRKTPAAL